MKSFTALLTVALCAVQVALAKSESWRGMSAVSRRDPSQKASLTFYSNTQIRALLSNGRPPLLSAMETRDFELTRRWTLSSGKGIIRARFDNGTFIGYISNSFVKNASPLSGLYVANPSAGKALKGQFVPPIFFCVVHEWKH